MTSLCDAGKGNNARTGRPYDLADRIDSAVFPGLQVRTSYLPIFVYARPTKCRVVHMIMLTLLCVLR